MMHYQYRSRTSVQDLESELGEHDTVWKSAGLVQAHMTGKENGEIVKLAAMKMDQKGLPDLVRSTQ